MKELTYIISELTECENEISKNVKRVYDFDYQIISDDSSLSLAVKSFKEQLGNFSKALNCKVGKIQNTILTQMKCFLIQQVGESRSRIAKSGAVENEFKGLLNELSSSKSLFHSLANSVEEVKISYEIAKLNSSVKAEQKLKLESKLNQLVKEAKDSENQYISNLSTCNTYKKFYVEKVEEILDSFQAMEVEYNKFMKKVLIDYNNDLLNFHKECINNIEKDLVIIDKVDPDNDILLIVNKHQTNILPPTKLEYVPYQTQSDKVKITKSIDMSNCYNISVNELTSTIRNFMKSTFLTEVPDSDNQQELKVFNEIKGILNGSWDGRVIDEADKKTFSKHMKEKIFRKYFLTCLNKFRINGMFILDSEAYNNIVDLLTRLLDICNTEKDYESMKFCMILSQTFYKAYPLVHNYINSEYKEQLHKDSFVNIGSLASPQISTQLNQGDQEKESNILIKILNEGGLNSEKSINNYENSPRGYDADGLKPNSSHDEAIKRKKNNKELAELALSSPRIFVQNGLQSHEALSSLENWTGMIKYSIKEELSTKSGLYLSDNPLIRTEISNSKEIINEMLKNISFGQLISFSFNMITFGFTKEQVTDIINNICTTHEIPQELQFIIHQKVEECSEEARETVRKDIVDKNISHTVDEEFNSIIKRSKSADKLIECGHHLSSSPKSSEVKSILIDNTQAGENEEESR